MPPYYVDAPLPCIDRLEWRCFNIGTNPPPLCAPVAAPKASVLTGASRPARPVVCPAGVYFDLMGNRQTDIFGKVVKLCRWPKLLITFDPVAGECS